MIQIHTNTEQGGSTLVTVAVRRMKHWKAYSFRCEKFYSHKRVARLLRELADKLEADNGSEERNGNDARK